MDISSLDSIAAITKVVNPKENVETSSPGVAEKEVDTSASTDKTTTTVKSQSPMELKLETQEAVNKLLKSINKLLGEGVEKLPPQLKEQLVSIIKQNTDSTNLNDGLANLLRAQKNINQDMLKLADTVVKNLFEQLEGNSATALPKNSNLATNLLKPESMFGDALPKETLLPDNLVEKALSEILAKTTTTGKEATTTLPTTEQEVPSNNSNPPAENTATKPQPTPENAPQKPGADSASKVPNEQNSTVIKQPENNANKPTEPTITKPPTNSDGVPAKPGADSATTNKMPSEQNLSNAKPTENMTGKTTVSNTEQSMPNKPATTVQENVAATKLPTENSVPTDKSATQLTAEQTKQTTEINTAAKTNVTGLKTDLPPDVKPETPMNAANRLVETLRLAENQNLPKTNQEVQTLLIGLKDNLLKLTENNTQLNNLVQKFLHEGKDLNKSETVLLNKFINDNLPKFLSDNKIIEQQILPKEALQILQKNSLNNNNEQTQKDLELLNNAGKNLNTSDAAKQIKTQVESWSNTIKDLANTFIKSNQNSPDTSKSLQTSFAFMMNGEDGKPKPAHIHIYHEKKRRDNNIEKPAETWLKLSLDYEYAGEVNAVFHLKNESVLDIKVSFSESDAIAPFKTFIPDIKNALAGGKLSLTQIVAE